MVASQSTAVMGPNLSSIGEEGWRDERIQFRVDYLGSQTMRVKAAACWLHTTEAYASVIPFDVVEVAIARNHNQARIRTVFATPRTLRRRGGDLPPARSSQNAAARRHHHGRQRPLGRQARSQALPRPPAGS